MLKNKNNKYSQRPCCLIESLYASNFTPYVKEARNQSQIVNRKSISPIKNLPLIPCFFHLWSEVTWM